VLLPIAWYHAAWGGLLVAGVGQLGDLAASAFKRDAQLKDSGTGVPGFGGVLDVVDSPILAAPVAYWLLTLAPHLAASPP
jgi:phosphatidate cytidylyltransferase